MPADPMPAQPVPAGPAGAPDRGVIHDIGYRHYDGERGGRPQIRRALFVDGLRAAYGLGRAPRSKVVPLLLLGVMCLPALASVAITAVVGEEELLAGYTAYLLNLQVVLAIYVAAQAPVLVSRDLRFGVMALYLSRPLARTDYVIGRYAAMVAALLIMTGLPLLLSFAGALVIGLPLAGQLPEVLQALGGAVLLSLVLAGIGLVIAAITPRRGLAVAAIITVLTVLPGVQAVAQGIAYEGGAGDGAAYLGLLSPFTLVDGVQAGLLGSPTPLPVPPGTTGALVFAATAALVIAGCLGALVLRYRSVSVA